VFKERPM